MKNTYKSDFIEGFAFIKNTRGFLPVVIYASIANFSITPVSILLPYFVRFDHLGIATDLALVTAAIQGGVLLGGLFILIKKEFNENVRVAMIIESLIYIGYAMIALTPNGMFWVMALGGMIFAIGQPIYLVLWLTVFKKIIPLEMQGRVTSVTIALPIISSTLAMIFAGTIAEIISIASLFVGLIGLGLLNITVVWFFTDIRYIEQVESQNDNSESP